MMESKKINNNNNNNNNKKKKKKKKKRGGSKRKLTAEQIVAYDAVNEWVSLGQAPRPAPDDFLVRQTHSKFAEKAVFELHCHSICSDGFLSPSSLVERAHANGVKVLALTDHDTMSGIPEAVEAACRLGIKIIPGVEISTIFSPRVESETGEPVHILAYYGGLGPAEFDRLEKFLSNIRTGRFIRARNIVSRLNDLKLPLKWEHVLRVAGEGVAPGRLHVARAMVEAGLVENLKKVFTRYLYDGGPAYFKGNEPLAEEAVQLICDTGGVAVLAHPWSLKNPISIIGRLRDAGLHGLEVYRSDGKLAAFSELADNFALLKLGGSDYHGRRGKAESELGSANLPILAVHEFLKVACPIWCSAIKEIVRNYSEKPSESNLERLLKFVMEGNKERGSSTSRKELIECCLSNWLTVEDRGILSSRLRFDAV